MLDVVTLVVGNAKGLVESLLESVNVRLVWVEVSARPGMFNSNLPMAGCDPDSQLVESVGDLENQDVREAMVLTSENKDQRRGVMGQWEGGRLETKCEEVRAVRAKKRRLTMTTINASMPLLMPVVLYWSANLVSRAATEGSSSGCDSRSLRAYVS